MYIIFKTYTPKKLSRDQKNLIEKLADTNLDTEETEAFNKFTKKNDK
jgi:DnaJ-class molecular chaperone